MRKIFCLIFCLANFSFAVFAQTNFELAKQLAQQNNKLILLNFSGSDWCGPCMRMRKEIFNTSQFSNMADTCLIMVNADFPRNKKNQLTPMLTKQNESLAERYNPSGKFPFTLLLDAKGNTLKSWDGLPKEDALVFAQRIKTICDAHK